MWNIILHIVSILISICALCFAYLRCEPLEKDWLGILVGVLSLLVTILLGWNIYQIISVDKRIKDKINIAEKRFKKDTAIWNLKSLSYAVSNSYYSSCYDNAILLLSFIPKHLEYGMLHNDAKVINEQILSINKVLDVIEDEKIKISDESYRRFTEAFSDFELFDSVLRRLKNIQLENSL